MTSTAKDIQLPQAVLCLAVVDFVLSNAAVPSMIKTNTHEDASLVDVAYQ